MSIVRGEDCEPITGKLLSHTRTLFSFAEVGEQAFKKKAITNARVDEKKSLSILYFLISISRLFCTIARFF